MLANTRAASLLLAVCAFVLSACAPAPVPSASPTPLPTASAAPLHTPMPQPSSVPTATSTPPPTFAPAPSETPAPTATPAELTPTSCLDKSAETAVVQTFLQEKGYDTLDAAMNDFVTDNLPGFGVGGRDTNTSWELDTFSSQIAERITLSKALLLGQFVAKHENIELHCITVAYPALERNQQGVSVVPRVINIISDATIDGKWTKVNYGNSPKEYVLMDSFEVAWEWINSRIGKSIQIQIIPALVPNPQRPPVFGLSFDNAGDSWHRLMTIADGTAVQWLGADPSKYPDGVSPVTPDPAKLAEGIRKAAQNGNEYEPGFFSGERGFIDVSP